MVAIVDSTTACKHCRRTRVTIWMRGLCCRCGKTPGVLALYPPLDRPVVTPRPSACRRCQAPDPTYPRGLCYRCYRIPGVKEQYPSQSAYGNRPNAGDARRDAPPPGAPCGHPPGSEGRIATLAGRAARGEQLFHPADYTGAE